MLRKTARLEIEQPRLLWKLAGIASADGGRPCAVKMMIAHWWNLGDRTAMFR
jgi:hypothetical protein